MRILILLSVLLASALVVPGAQRATAAAPITASAPAAPVSPAPPRWASGRVLELNRAGPGEVVVALGDPVRARHVAIIVPGVGNDLASFDDPAHPTRRPYGMAQALHAQAPDTVVIAWLGYRPPTGLDLASVAGDRARQGAAALRAFVLRVRAQAAPDAAIGLVCHSYGSVVCGLAAPRLPVNDLVFLASPGVRANSVAGLHTAATVYAATAATDWIRWVPHVRIGDLGHGPDPSAPAFGAGRLPTEGVSGHDGYFAPRSATLHAVAGIVSHDRRS